MADAKACDRCGAFYLPYWPKKGEPQFQRLRLDLVYTTGTYYRTTATMDLCPQCAAYLHAVLFIDRAAERSGDRSLRRDNGAERSGDRSLRGDNTAERSGDRSLRGDNTAERSGDRSLRGENGGGL